MATGSISDEWMYNEVLDEDLPLDEGGSETTRRVSVDSTDLLDDVLTIPSTMNTKEEQQDDVELSFVQEPENGLTMEESASARYKAEQMAKTVQARIETNKTSQSSIDNSDIKTIFSRDPNKRNSVFVGNLTWWTTDMDIVQAVKDVGLGAVKILKFIENKTNGQSKGMAIVELANEALALGAPDKLQQITLYDKKIIAAFAGRMSVQQFEAKCQGKSVPERKNTIKPQPIKPPLSMSTGGVPTAPFRPPIGGFPSVPTFPGLRPPGMLDPSSLLQQSFPPMLNAVPRMPSVPPPPIPPVSTAFGVGGLSKPPPTAPHLNPAFLQELSSQGSNVAELFAKAGAHFQNQNQSAPGLLGNKSGPTEEETADTNQRNRAISSSAITRAMADANAGDYESAVDILRMAITLIKQSITAGTESNQMLIQSLQDCLHGIEQQASAGMKRSKGHERSRDNSHDRERSGRSHHSSSKQYRDRSRERRR